MIEHMIIVKMISFFCRGEINILKGSNCKLLLKARPNTVVTLSATTKKG